MSFKFADIQGFDTDLAAKLDADTTVTEAIGGYVQTASADAIAEGVKNRVEVEKGEFKKKLQDVFKKLEDAENKLKNAPDIDPDELAALKQIRDKSPELQATLKAMEEKNSASLEQLEKAEGELSSLRLKVAMNESIAAYNTDNPTRKVKEDMRDVLHMLASSAIKYDEDAKDYRVYDQSGAIVATDKGAATPVDWLTLMREQRPSAFDPLPAGSGASGSNSSGGADSKTMSRSDFDKLPPVEQAKVARTHTFTD